MVIPRYFGLADIRYVVPNTHSNQVSPLMANDNATQVLTQSTFEANNFFCTLTGADDHVQQADLWHIASHFRPGLVEWGILYSTNNQGVGRYPSFEWIEQLVGMMGRGKTPRFSLHVCGRAVEQFLNGTGHVSDIAKAFPRIQVNFRAREYPIEVIKAAMSRYTDKTIITQHNFANAALWRDLRGFKNHAILFDQSGGRGISPVSWPAPIEGVYSGYAGGLGLDNLENQLKAIRAASRGPSDYWIDAEGKLRDARDRFDIAVARKFLEVVTRFESDMHNHNAEAAFPNHSQANQ